MHLGRACQGCWRSRYAGRWTGRDRGRSRKISLGGGEVVGGREG